MLYLVATPIGNLEDLGLRALRVLREADFIICERPRHTLRLLNHYQITGKRLVGYTEANKKRQIPFILKLLQEKSAAFVADAGTVGIADPGPELVVAVREKGIAISCVPGPSALAAAIALAGIRLNKFIFVSFLPKKQKELQGLLNLAIKEKTALIGFEAPHRIMKTLKFLEQDFPEVNITLVSEISKIHEKVLAGRPKDLLKTLTQDSKLVKGEFVIVITTNN